MSIQLNDEQRKLVADNHNLIYQYLIDNNLPQDEYYDIVAIGLCKAALKYDTSKGAFSTYVYKTVRNIINNEKPMKNDILYTLYLIILQHQYMVKKLT